MIPEARIKTIEKCSGHGGSWGAKNFDEAVQVGTPVARQITRNAGSGMTYSLSLSTLSPFLIHAKLPLTLYLVHSIKRFLYEICRSSPFFSLCDEKSSPKMTIITSLRNVLLLENISSKFWKRRTVQWSKRSYNSIQYNFSLLHVDSLTCQYNDRLSAIYCLCLCVLTDEKMNFFLTQTM